MIERVTRSKRLPASSSATAGAVGRDPEVVTHRPPFEGHLPAPIVFRAFSLPARAIYPRHRHAWGEFVYSFCGLMEVRLADQHLVAPPHHGIWLPPEVEHRGLNRQATIHSSLYVAAELCRRLPTEVCALSVGPLARAVLDQLHAEPPAVRPGPEDGRLMQVLLDRLACAPRLGSYLPRSSDPVLAAVLARLEAQPGEDLPLEDLAHAVHTTERTLARRARRDLGMTIAEWRQRLRVLQALPRLEAGEKVSTIAYDLGYSSASAFIVMFRRLTGMTPDEHRRTLTRPGSARPGADAFAPVESAGPGGPPF